MSMNRPDDNGGTEFRHPHLRELDTLMLALAPAKRAGFLDSVYAGAMKGNYDSEFLTGLAELLKKWSTEKRSFLNHAEKLLAKNGQEISETRDNTAELIKTTISEGERD